MLRVVVALATLAMLVAGCSKTIAGSATGPLTAQQALGDFTTIDYRPESLVRA